MGGRAKSKTVSVHHSGGALERKSHLKETTSEATTDTAPKKLKMTDQRRKGKRYSGIAPKDVKNGEEKPTIENLRDKKNTTAGRYKRLRTENSTENGLRSSGGGRRRGNEVYTKITDKKNGGDLG